MQSSARASAIALCALATLTACEQFSSTNQLDSDAPDNQPETASNRSRTGDRGTAEASRPEVSPEVSRPESSGLSTSMGDLPTLRDRGLPPLPSQSSLSRLTSRLPLPTRSTWQPPRTAPAAPTSPAASSTPTQMPNVDVPGSSIANPAQQQTNLTNWIAASRAAALANSQTPSGAAAASTAPSPTPSPTPAAVATATSPQTYSSQSSTLPGGVEPITYSGQTIGQSSSQSAQPSAFTDLQGHWSQQMVSTLADTGIIQGFPDGLFYPDEVITQPQFTAMVQKAFPDEEIQPELIRLTPGMTRAEAAKVIYQALADQGRIAPLSTLVASQSMPLPDGAQPSTPAATPAAQATIPASPTLPNREANQAAIAPQFQPEASNSATATVPTPEPTPQAAQTPAAAPELQTAPIPRPAPLELATPEVMRPEVIRMEATPTPAIPTPTAPAQAEPEPIAPAQPEPAQTAPAQADPMATAPASPISSVQAEAQPSSTVIVSITGEVVRPGAYSLSNTDAANGQPTLMQAIQRAGGITPAADIRQIQVRRAGGADQPLTINLWQTLQTGDLSKDTVLQPGDTIAIPKAAETPTAAADSQATPITDRIEVSVVGEVNNPGRLELPPDAFASQAILASGGFKQQAQQAELIRLNTNGTVARRSITLNPTQGSDDETNPALQNNDVILVQRTNGTATAMRSLPQLNPLLGALSFFPKF
ncbi:SLBB domain-containing protein [Phormidium tenue FACHB-886]|nr:SLBB domain-containing protein [Phormidium tenue FACHB-886]